MQRMQRHNIINNTLRLALLAVALLAACFSLHAAANVPTAIKPQGLGTTESPYLVTTVGEFMYINTQPGAVYRQEADLDFTGYAFDNSVINGRTNGSNVIKEFNGIYDGNGFTIKNIIIDWSSKPTPPHKTHYVNGIFLNVSSGSIRNLELDNIKLLYGDVDKAYEKTSDVEETTLEMGVLCGNLYNGAKIENIIIKNSKIEAKGDPNATNYFVGGLVGDVRSAAAGSADINAIIRNIYAQVDIDLHNATRHTPSVDANAARPHQFQIGGIVGRLRTVHNKDYVPVNTMYEGTINAPIAMIGPCYGAIRTSSSGVGGGYFTTVYSGQLDGAIMDSQEDDENRYFGKYAIYHYYEDAAHPSGDIKAEYVTDVVPDGVGCYNGTRTFSPNYKSNVSTVIEYTQAKPMASFQGVNHGTYFDASKDPGRSEVLEMYREYSVEKGYAQITYSAEKGFYFDKATIHRSAYQTFELLLFGVSHSDFEKYHTKWYITENKTNAIREIESKFDANGKCSIDFTNNAILSALPHVEHYKHLKVELYNETNELQQTIDYDLTSPSVTLFRRSVLLFGANIACKTPGFSIAYKIDQSKNGTKNVIKTGTFNKNNGYTSYEFASQSDLPEKIGIGLYDKKNQLLSDTDGNDIYVEISVDDIDLELLSKYTYKVYRKGNEIVAEVRDEVGNLISGWDDSTNSYLDNNHINFIWEVNPDPANSHEWNRLSSYGNHIPAYASDIFYRASWVYDNFLVDDKIFGNKTVIFVYDKQKHAEKDDLTTKYGLKTPITLFDGKEHWKENEVEMTADFPDGDDANDGRDPYHAVKTLQRAYELLDPDNGPEDNIIVVMGFNYDPHFLDLTNAGYDALYIKAATITGKKGNISGGAIVFSNSGSNPMGLSAATAFENISICGFNEEKYSACYSSSADEKAMYLYCNLHDLTFGENVVMRAYRTIGVNQGTIDRTVPDISIVGGVYNFNIADGELESYQKKCKWNKDDKFTTITIKSGCYGRIIGGSRNNGANGTSKNLFGNPKNPHRIRLNIDINHNIETNKNKEYWPDGNSTYDIGLVTGGQTDGSIFGEAEIEMNNGYIGRYISGNISFGRSAGNSNPSDTYFGSTIFNFRGGTIQELYGGSLGRATSANVSTLQAYFYGRSIINIVGGIVNTDLNGAGAGGVAGLGTDIYHTDDIFIPYYDVNSKLSYGNYEKTKGKVVTMPLSNDSILYFTKTYSEINIKYGEVHGNIYGAGGGYSVDIPVDKASSQAGNLYGNCYITISEDEPLQSTIIVGSVYGAGAGSDGFYNKAAATNKSKFTALAQLYGNCDIKISGGTIKGDVFAGAQGVAGFPDMAATYGNTNLEITGGTINGNIYGGSGLANIRRYELSEAEATENADAYQEGDKYYLKDTGNTYVSISGGVIGNCIFGGSQGDETTKAMIDGDTHVTITGGEFIDTPYIDIDATDDTATGWDVLTNPEKYRNFNIYGGGNVNCDISGTAYVKVYSSLLNSEFSFVPKTQNPNALTSHDKSERFQSAYMDVTYRRFCVYGGGYGEKTNVLNTDVYVTIPPERMGVTLPHGNTLTSYLPHQSFFDIAGGGYSGDVGYWATEGGARAREIDKKGKTAAEVAALYHHYVGGRCKVTIDGYTYARKIIGGGFYGSSRSTNTHVLCGSLRQVYGGSLLGYVHDKALLQFGNRSEDFIRKVDSVYVYDAAGCFGDHYGESDEYIEYEGDKAKVSATVWAQAEARAKQLNDYIFITEDIYGGNDVKGIIGTQLYRDELTKEYAIDATDGGPLFQTDVTKTEEKGIVFNIYGGTFMDNVYGAGNGHYRGYYVPEWVRYNDGPARMYRMVQSSTSTDPTKKARAYRSRPMVGSVNVNLRGNSPTDYVKLHKDFFGGGSECTIGQFNTILPLEDPRRMIKGGHLHVNFGGYVQIDGNVYMGAEGRTIGSQQVVPEGVKDLQKFDGSTTAALAELGEIAYGHWYYDSKNGCYMPGFPAKGEVDGNFHMTGQHMFDSYMQNVQMQGDIETTFYRNLYERDDEGHFEYWKENPKDPNSKDLIDATGQRIRVRKHWAPGELATKTEWEDNDPEKIYAYDAQGITMNSFYLGGLSGTMTNNNLMAYCYTTHTEIDPNVETTPEHDHEAWGSIYRVTLPAGVTVRDKVVMGSENATVECYGYEDGYHSLKTKDNNDNEIAPTYVYEGGLTTQKTYSFDLIVYNDAILQGADIRHYLPADFYDAGKYTDIKAMTRYELQYGKDAGTTIYRKTYDKGEVPTLNAAVEANPARFGLATTDTDFTTAYVGPREKRRENTGNGAGDNAKTVTKLTVACQFDPLSDGNSTGEDDHAHHYGGNIYGGCYRSGIVVGNVVMNIGSNLLGSHFDETDAATFGEISSLKYNIGRVFGGGFGEKTRIEGDTYVNLLKNFRGMNVFGGGMQGDVTGTAHVIYIGAEDKSYVFGHIYGGGLMGSVGSPQYLDAEKTQVNPDATDQSTVVRLYSGNVDRVYGGSCMGNLYGRTFVELCDAVTDELDHLDVSKMKFDWAGSRLIAGKVFGGNDISGNIVPYVYATAYSGDDFETKEFRDYSTGVYVHEIPESTNGSGAPAHEAVGPGKTSPGSDSGYNGFPLIGDLYGGGNGDYGTQNGTIYTTGEVSFATGEGTESEVLQLNSRVVPDATTTHIYLAGGTVINAYGGADMSTVTKDAKVSVNYPKDSFKARAGFETKEELERVWRVLHFSSDELMDEVTTQITVEENTGGTATTKKCPIFAFPVYRLFGGNNNADMDIQPSWDLESGFVGSLYSGGNFGRMTYYNPTPETDENKGLTLTIDSDDMHIDNVYGGARVGDIMPLEYVAAVVDPNTNEITEDAKYQLPSDPGDDFYGATLNIHRGVIEHVYGGNDVAGYVHFGTNVNIYGAISGDVYCAGNGNYLYKYDRQGDQMDYSDEQHARIQEHYEFETAEYKGARYFLLPAKGDYGQGFDLMALDDDGHATGYAATDAQTIMAINSYRPNVERTKLFIEGTAENPVWVKGSVYCGGNSSTVVTDKDDAVQFQIGSYVTLNGVFLGSNGESLADGQMIQYTEKLNAVDGKPLDMTADNDLTTDQIPAADQSALVTTEYEYPRVLDLYMRAVEVAEKPSNFSFGDITEAYIGDFVIGGNRGSMLTSKKIELTFPETLTIYNRIIGGCRHANVEYKGKTHLGGLTRAVTPPTPTGSPLPAKASDNTKLQLDIKSKFIAQKIKYNESDNTIALVSAKDASTGYPDGICNIYGGCYQSGTTIGDILIEVYSDMLHYDTDPTEDSDHVVKADVVKGMEANIVKRNFTVFGGGYGQKSAVRGDINVRLLPTAATATEGVKHPSAASVFGGAQEGLVIGDTRVEIRDGKILGNVYGASEAAVMQGNTAVIVGYPTYYTAKEAGVFSIKRSDYFSETARKNKKMANGNYAMVKSVAYDKGEIVSSNVYDMIIGRVRDNVVEGTREIPVPGSAGTYRKYDIGMEVESDAADTYMLFFNPAAADEQKHIDYYFTKHEECPHNIDPTLRWDDIVIWIGDQGSSMDDTQPYYGQGNVYGGGFIPNVASQSLSGKHTVLRYDNSIYGGNTAVMIWDNKNNATIADGGTDKHGNKLKDHVSVGTSHYVEVPTVEGLDKMGYYEKLTVDGKEIYVYQTSGKMVSDGHYYTKEADGGIYGGGRKVFVEGFSSVDLAYYGYAEHSPEDPKLLNTLQRADVVTVTDCCMELIGAADFTNDNFDATLYAVNRVGELRMVSSLSGDAPLVGSTKLAEGDHILRYTQPRSRNYIGFYHKVHDLASFYSNWTMERKYHGSDGKVSNKDMASSGRKYYWRNEAEEAKIAVYLDTSEYSVDADGKIDITNWIIKKYASGGIETYTLHKHDIVEDYYDKKENNFVGLDETQKAEALDLFNQRNIGTSGNMIGIRSGYSLTFQGHCLADENSSEEVSYSGPVYGVTEMKLLTVAVGEGGGYVYALNHHYDPAVDGKQLWQETDAWMSEWGQDFYMVSGNFVFPGAAYMTTDEHDASKKNSNYIIDDCMPETIGYDGLSADLANGQTGHYSGYGVNQMDDQHYWYVNGQIYRFNVTLTGITSDDTDPGRNFWLNDKDDIVTLVTLKHGAKVRVSEVTWMDDPAAASETRYDLVDTDKDYKLYFTIDHNTHNAYDKTDNGAYVAEISRASMSDDTDGGYKGGYAQYTESGETHNNLPRLGIRLFDNVKNRLADPSHTLQDGRDYYNAHLDGQHYAQVVLEAQNEGETLTYKFIVNLTINYLLGPLVRGDIEIENCALPGEYIYVNTKNVEVDMDATMGVTNQFFKIYPTKEKTEGGVSYRDRIIDDSKIPAEYISYKVEEDNEEYKNCLIEGNERMIHIPAYYYMDGWEVTFGVTAGGEDFEITLPGYDTKEVEDDANPGQKIKVPDYEMPLPENRLQVHNYHRMKPRYNVGGKPIDLRYVEGARIYIEDDEDLKEYLEYHKRVSTAGYAPETLADGRYIHPANGEGLNFMLMDNVIVPVASEFSFAATDEIVLGSRFHGNGRIVTIPDGAALKLNNVGNVYNTGFVSEVTSAETTVFDTNTGLIQNCYYFNTAEQGRLAKYDESGKAQVLNCYQNTPVNTAYKYNQMMRMSTMGFRYGQVAYNLNSFYLQKRHILLHGPTATDAWHTDNNSIDLAAKDKKLKAASNYVDYDVDYIEWMFNNGDYRYAFYNLSQDYPQFTEALRTAPEPNYFDYLGNHATGKPVSMHDYTHKVDESRWCNIHQVYHPRFDLDYLFFGQNLTVHVDEHNTTLPEMFSPDTRVYRVGGFYGSAADKGYYFNRKAFVDSPIMTAVDFVGYRDRDLYDGTSLKSEVRGDIEADGWVINDRQQIFCPPVIDLPWVMEGSTPMHDFESLTIDTDKVTHNLLVYTRDNDKAASYVAPYHYHQDFVNTQPQYHSDEGIRVHHIVDVKGGTPRMYGDYFHLVDGHPFNAPVAFNVKQGWYTRKPAKYAEVYTYTASGYKESFKTAWETICLPFDVEMTYAATTDRNKFSQDMGEITHFFGAEYSGHEYWLRRLVGYNEENEKLQFERPTEGNKHAKHTDKIGDLAYSNSTLRDLYHNAEYQDEHDELYHGADNSWSRTIENYRYLTGGIPYIVTYPGENFYEFDLSGVFYKSTYDIVEEAVPQSITYFVKQKEDGNYATIPVTDTLKGAEFAAGSSGYAMAGTFANVSNAEADRSVLCDVVSDLYVINDDGTEFVKAKAGQDSVAPFHAYVYKVKGSSGKPSRGLLIGGDVETLDEEEEEVVAPDEPEQPADELEAGIEFWVQEGALYIRTPYEVDLHIYNMTGQAVRHIRAYEGLNRYTGLSAGYYVVGGFKFMIR